MNLEQNQHKKTKDFICKNLNKIFQNPQNKIYLIVINKNLIKRKYLKWVYYLKYMIRILKF
jgi:hypothetical protein